MVRKRIPNLPAFTPNTPKLDKGSNLKARTPATPVSNKKSISSSHYNTIFLHDWWLVKPQGKGLAVGGVASMERLGERVIFSTPIAKRHETNVLETQDGITLIITGFINKSRTHENGFSFEICRHFLLGFPYDWEEYLSCGSGEEPDNGNTGLDDSRTCPLKSAGDAVSFLIHDNIRACEIADLFTKKGDLNCWLLKKYLNDASGTSPDNVSKQSDPPNNMECNITLNAKECKGDEDTSLKTCQIQDGQMYNIENGVSDVIHETQDENPTFGFDSRMKMTSPEPCGGPSGKGMHNIENGVSDVIHETQDENPTLGFDSRMKMNSPQPCGGPSGKGTDKSPDSSKKKHSISSAREQMISEVADNNFSRIIRSTSESRTRLPLGKGKKNTVVNYPVRRSPRLSNLKSQAFVCFFKTKKV